MQTIETTASNNSAANTLRLHRNLIIDLWEEEARRTGHEHLCLTPVLPELLEYLASALSLLPGITMDRIAGDIDQIHHRYSRHLGTALDVSRLISEYHILRATLFSVLETTDDLTTEARRFVFNFIDICARSGAEEFVGHLERFASIAAHDLKSPLNAITQFADLLAADYRGKMGPEADRCLDFIIRGGERMRKLIDQLLSYARAGTAMGEKRPVDCASLFAPILEDLREEISSKNARVELIQLPTLPGDEVALTQLFENLVSNALKFSRPGVPPIVKVSSEETQACWTIRVQDNGTGIPAEHQSFIFQFATRLQLHQKIEGSGIGLAICKRIVEAHGGRIWAESAGEGSIIAFTIPKH